VSISDKTARLFEEIHQEIARVVGPAGVDVWPESDPEYGIVARVETSEAVWRMPPEELLLMLHGMPNRAGVLALREEADRSPRRIRCS
jgi:hypothetical protein